MTFEVSFASFLEFTILSLVQFPPCPSLFCEVFNWQSFLSVSVSLSFAWTPPLPTWRSWQVLYTIRRTSQGDTVKATGAGPSSQFPSSTHGATLRVWSVLAQSRTNVVLLSNSGNVVSVSPCTEHAPRGQGALAEVKSSKFETSTVSCTRLVVDRDVWY